MLDRKKVLNQLIPILRPYLTVTPSELATFKLVKVPTDCTKEVNPFGTIQLIEFDTIGMTEFGEVIQDVGLQYKEHYELTVRVNTYSDDAMFRSDILKSNLKNPSVVELLTANGFGFKDTSPVKDLTALNTTKFEERSRIDIYLYASAGDLHKFTSTDTADVGKAGQGNFFNVDQVASVDVVSFQGLPIEQTDQLTNS